MCFTNILSRKPQKREKKKGSAYQHRVNVRGFLGAILRWPWVLRLPLCLLQPLPSLFLTGSRHNVHPSSTSSTSSNGARLRLRLGSRRRQDQQGPGHQRSRRLRPSCSPSPSLPISLSHCSAYPPCSSPCILMGFRCCGALLKDVRKQSKVLANLGTSLSQYRSAGSSTRWTRAQP